MNEITDWLQNVFFARHETFCPRYGWLKKGFDAVHDHERIGNEDREFTFNNDDKPTLPDAIFLAACFDYAAHTQPTLQTLSLPKIVYGFNSPGVVFRVTESEAGHRLEKSADQIKGVEFTDSYGNRQLQFNQSPDRIRDSILEQYYRNN